MRASRTAAPAATGTATTGNGHGGNGRDGSGYPGHGGRRPGGSTALKEPDVRRRPGRHGGGDGGFGGGGREHRKGDWWRHWTLKKAVSIGAIAAGVMVVLGAVGVGIAYSKTPVPTDPQLSAIQSASTVYFSNNKTRVGQFGTVDRQVLLYNQIPAILRNAVVAAEDKNFWHEGGISPTGILRAAYYDLTSSGGNLQGGSTITQQLVRNYYANVGTAQTVTRKVKEIFVAQKLAQRTSKEQILKEYLNTVYFGHQAYGVGAARSVLLRPAPLADQPGHGVPGRDDRRHDPEPQLLQPQPEGRRPLPGPGRTLALRDQRHGRHGHAVAAGRGQGEVPHGRQALQQQLGRLPRLHHAGGVQ